MSEARRIRVKAREPRHSAADVLLPDRSVFPVDGNMAEYSQAGLLAALLFFTALTIRDVYLGRSSLQRPGLSPSSSPDLEPVRTAKASSYSGPVLRFQYCIS